MRTWLDGASLSARQHARRGRHDARLRALAASLLGLSLAACGGGGGGGSTPVTGVVPFTPPTGIGPTIPQGAGDGSSYTANIAASTVDAGGNQTLVQAPSASGSMRFDSNQTVITAPDASQTVTLRNSDIIQTDLRTLTFASPAPPAAATFQGSLARLDHVAMATWARIPTPGVLETGAAVAGIRTPGSDVPTSGAASYRGVAFGSVVTPTASATWTGQSELSVHFGLRNVSGQLTNMRSVDLTTGVQSDFNRISLSGNWAPGSDAYAGTATAGVSPGGPSAISQGSSGPLQGAFFGSGPGAARETGGTFTINAPSNGGVVHGSFVASRQPPVDSRR